MARTITHNGQDIRTDADGWPVKVCRRCDGAGHYSFNGFDDICYLCGNGQAKQVRIHTDVTLADALDRAAADEAKRAAGRASRDRARERKAAAERAARDAARDALAPAFDAYPLAVDLTYLPNLEATTPAAKLRGYGFAFDRWQDGRALSDKMLSIASEVTARFVAAAGVAGLSAGRQVLTGEVLSTRVVDSDYGSVVKMTVRLDSGQRVYGTMPRAITVDKGDRVEFTATVEPSADDPAFGFYSRPTKASALTPA